MKNVNQNSNQTHQEQTPTHSDAIEFNEVVVYHEMADQTAVRINLLEQVNTQLLQLELMIQRRDFVMREVFQSIAD